MPGKNKSEKTNEVQNNCGMFNTCEPEVEDEREGHPIKLRNAGSYWTNSAGMPGIDHDKNSYANAPKVANVNVKTWLTVSRKELEQIFPGANKEFMDELVSILNEYMEFYGINTKNKLAHFLGQIGEETDGLVKTKVEGTNWTEATLKRIKPALFKGKKKTTMVNGQKVTTEEAPKYNPAEYAGQSEKAANLVYSKEGSKNLGNGPPESGDGYKYRGRGIIMVTGKSNYKAFTKSYRNDFGGESDFEENPELLMGKRIAIISALDFFKRNVLNAVTIPPVPGKNEVPVSKKPEQMVLEKSVINRVTVHVNSQQDGIEKRIKYYKAAAKVFFNKNL